MNLKPYQNHIIFKTPTLFNDKVKINGRQIILDPSFNPELHVRTYGEVVHVPSRMGNQPMPLQESIGTPSYHEYAPVKFKLLSDIEPVVNVSDRIYVHFNTITQRNIVKEEGEGDDKMYFIAVRYDNVICAVRDGRILMVGSYALVEPDMESYDEILIPTFYDIKDKEGNPMPKPKEFWIQKKVAPEAKFLKGFVRHIDKPLKGDVRECNPGDHIIYKRNADWKMTIEGAEYFAIRQRHIEGRLVTTEN